MILWGYLSGFGYGLVCLLLSFILYKLGMPKKYTRKVVHILVGFEWVFLYNFMGAGIHFLLVCIAFLLLLLVAYFTRMMPMISSDDDNSPGTVYYAVAMCGVAILACFLPDLMLPFGIGIFCTSIGDGFAGLVGQAIRKNNPKVYKNKSVYGTLANFVFSFGSVLVMKLVFDMPLNPLHMLLIAALSTLLELVVGLGLDNIVVTWGVTALAYSFINFPGIMDYIFPIILTPLVIILADRGRALTTSGIVAAIIVDVCISVSLGNFGFLLLLAFLVLGVVIDKIKKLSKNRVVDEAEKGDCRDHMQVLANGLIPSAAAVAYLFTKNEIFIVAFVASLGEALADTAASGFGAFSRRTFDPFRMKKTENGISGGMSLLGTFASLIFAFLFPLVAWLCGMLEPPMLLLAGGAAFFGAVFDSFLGSLVQAKYKCTVCGKVTEKSNHCGAPTEHIKGLKFINNDIVNLISAASSFAYILIYFGIILLGFMIHW